MVALQGIAFSIRESSHFPAPRAASCGDPPVSPQAAPLAAASPPFSAAVFSV